MAKLVSVRQLRFVDDPEIPIVNTGESILDDFVVTTETPPPASAKVPQTTAQRISQQRAFLEELETLYIQAEDPHCSYDQKAELCKKMRVPGYQFSENSDPDLFLRRVVKRYLKETKREVAIAQEVLSVQQNHSAVVGELLEILNKYFK